MDAVLIPLFLVLGAAIALYALAVPQGGRAWWGFGGATLLLVLAGRLAGQGTAGTLLTDLAELCVIGLVWSHGTEAARAAARMAATAIVPGIVLAGIAGAMLGGIAPDGIGGKLAVALLMLGTALKLGLVPVYFWLPAVARAAPAMTTALIVAVVDVNGFCDLLALRGHVPWVFESYAGLWILLALASVLGGALLALAQTELKPLLVFSSIDDLGYLLLGLVLGGAEGGSGAWFGIVSHAITKIVLFGAVGAAEAALGRPVTLDTRGLASRLPVASAAFMLGALGFLGMPPTLGFLGHWRLYLAGVQLGGPLLLAAMLAGSAIALLCYVRVIHRVWLGPAEAEPTGRLPALGGAVLLTLAVASVALGLAPGALQIQDAAVHLAQLGAP